ncbi:uncharacterized protein LOC121391274 [Gigantopelta aegis]|uniref:uncharacterized protein LOC121391274 n=1 Tax=Gigantopelta aegis TaxID=1735272 RepID=UPI001B889B23|nr:uncharacterized protein LOC121391274 [Gigantopelta aegis]
MTESTERSRESIGSGTSPYSMSTVDSALSIGSATSPSTPSLSEGQRKPANNCVFPTAKQTDKKNPRKANAKSKTRLAKKTKKKTKKPNTQKGKPSETQQEGCPEDNRPPDCPEDNRPLENLYWVTYFQNRMGRQDGDVPRVRRGRGPDTPRPRTRRGPGGCLLGTSYFKNRKDGPPRNKSEAVLQMDAEIDDAIDKLADKLLSRGKSADSKTTKDADGADGAEQDLIAARKAQASNFSKETKDTLNVLDEYISKIENLMEIQAYRRLIADSKPRGFRGDVLCPKCRLMNRKDPALEVFSSGRLRNVLCRKHSAADKPNGYRDQLTDDIDRIIDDLEEDWWYR